jgi:hypothetical protein
MNIEGKIKVLDKRLNLVLGLLIHEGGYEQKQQKRIDNQTVEKRQQGTVIKRIIQFKNEIRHEKKNDACRLDIESKNYVFARVEYRIDQPNHAKVIQYIANAFIHQKRFYIISLRPSQKYRMLKQKNECKSSNTDYSDKHP